MRGPGGFAVENMLNTNLETDLGGIIYEPVESVFLETEGGLIATTPRRRMENLIKLQERMEINIPLTADVREIRLGEILILI